MQTSIATPNIVVPPPRPHSPSGPTPSADPRLRPLSAAKAAGILNWPASERPRERLRRDGPQALSDSELLALFIRTSTPTQSALDIARAMLQHFGSLRVLLDSNNEDLECIAGLGPAKIAQLQAINELVKRSLVQRMRVAAALDSPQAIGEYLQLAIGARPYEVFITLYLDVKYRLIRADESSRGTLTHTNVYPREIVREGLRLNAAAVVVAHNHPSGEVEPSDADRFLTKRLKLSLDLVDITLLDHFVVSAQARWSFSEHGLL